MSLRCWLWFVVAGCVAGAWTIGNGTIVNWAAADETSQAPAEAPKPDAPKPDAKNPTSPKHESPKLKVAAPKPEVQKYVRLERTTAGLPIALQTVIVELKATRPEEAGVTVDLVGAVHLGEKAYYEALNEAFKVYDVVLYEMVAPAGASVPKGPQRSSHPVMLLQNAFKDVLRLEHQLEIVDYAKQNFVHADMSPEEFAKSMRDRHESIWDMLFRSLQHSLSKPDSLIQMGTGSEFELLLALVDKRQAVVLKRALAVQFADVDDLAKMLDGPNGSTILSERNKVALEELKRQIGAGKKRIAIFYGAAHLPDMQRRLIADFAMQPTGEHWLTAWTMPEAPRNAVGAQHKDTGAEKVKKRRSRKIDPPAEKQPAG